MTQREIHEWNAADSAARLERVNALLKEHGDFRLMIGSVTIGYYRADQAVSLPGADTSATGGAACRVTPAQCQCKSWPLYVWNNLRDMEGMHRRACQYFEAFHGEPAFPAGVSMASVVGNVMPGSEVPAVSDTERPPADSDVPMLVDVETGETLRQATEEEIQGARDALETLGVPTIELSGGTYAVTPL